MLTCRHGGMPDEGHCVPEHEGGVHPGLGGVHVVSPILALANLHLHELQGILNIYFHVFEFISLYLGDVERKGDGGDRDDVDQDPPGLRHCLRDCSEIGFR